MADKIKVLVVDDSALVRKIITDILERDPEIEVVGTANNGKTAIFKNQTLNPDVITLDIEMPIMDGLEALRNIIETNPKPVIMMSVLTQYGADATFKALEYGAVDFIPKPSSAVSLSVDEISDLLLTKIKSVHKSNVKLQVKRPDRKRIEEREERIEEIRLDEKKREITAGHTPRIVAIGTSTGGPSALIQVFNKFPDKFPSPVLVVQHMPEGFTNAFAERLDTNSTLRVKEASDGDKIMPGCGYIAPGHSHMRVESINGDKVLRVYKGEKVSGHRPSIDVLFNSIADVYSSNAVGVIMTGMGRDGAEGILKIKNKGGYTIAQNEETSVVYGMNRVAIQLGGVKDIVSLYQITEKIIEHL